MRAGLVVLLMAIGMGTSDAYDASRYTEQKAKGMVSVSRIDGVLVITEHRYDTATGERVADATSDVSVEALTAEVAAWETQQAALRQLIADLSALPLDLTPP